MIASVEAFGGDHSRCLGVPIVRAVQPWNNEGGDRIDAYSPDCEVIVEKLCGHVDALMVAVR